MKTNSYIASKQKARSNAVVFDAIRQLMAPPEPKKKRGIGFTANIEK